MQRRDAKGRFAGGGGSASIGGAARSTNYGKSAIRSARTVKAEVAGAKQRTQEHARLATNTTRRRGAPTVAKMYKQDAAQGRKRVKQMQRERKSLLRRGQINR
jgi:hypothetical protein